MVRATGQGGADRSGRHGAPNLYHEDNRVRTGGVVSTTSTTETSTSLSLTDAAVAKVSELLEQEGNAELFLRVAVRPGGCSGYSYEMFFDSDMADDDVESVKGSVKVVVDPASAALLTGATLDYKDGLQGAGFSIDNPNATRTCGCGQSFS
jgi:iron-sulfur cluster assembly accessory protein